MPLPKKCSAKLSGSCPAFLARVPTMPRTHRAGLGSFATRGSQESKVVFKHVPENITILYVRRIRGYREHSSHGFAAPDILRALRVRAYEILLHGCRSQK